MMVGWSDDQVYSKGLPHELGKKHARVNHSSFAWGGVFLFPYISLGKYTYLWL